MPRKFRQARLPAVSRSSIWATLKPYSLRSPASEAAALPRTGADRRGLRVGLMGGSFNPAHGGHLAIARHAFRHLALDEIWWLVSPQNPLKPVDGMSPFVRRFASARAMARHPRIRVRDIELHLGTSYTADTVSELIRRCPGTRFVWIMGADNLIGLHRWERWSQILDTVGVAVFDRPTYSGRALSSRAARRYSSRRIRERKSRLLADMTPPVWVFLHTRLDPTSATRKRELGETA